MCVARIHLAQWHTGNHRADRAKALSRESARSRVRRSDFAQPGVRGRGFDTGFPAVTAPLATQPVDAVLLSNGASRDGAKDSRAAVANALTLGSSLVGTL